MGGLGISDQNLFSRFWVSTDFKAVSRDYQAATGNRLSEIGGAPVQGPVQFTSETDTTLNLLVQKGGDSRYRNILGKAKAFAGKGADMNAAGNVALGLEISLESLSEDLAKMEKLRHNPKLLSVEVDEDEIAAAKSVLSTLLLSDECTSRCASGKPLSKAGVLALLNAGLGCLKLIEDGVATPESLFELMKGEVYDLTNPADVLKLSVQTARKARELFIDAEGVRETANAAKEYQRSKLELIGAGSEAIEQECARIDLLAEEVIAARARVVKMLDIEYNVGDGSKKTIEKAIDSVRERLRAFRYDCDTLTMEGVDAKPMTGRGERLRRFFDNLRGSKENRLDVAELRNVNRKEADFLDYLDENNIGDGENPVRLKVAVNRPWLDKVTSVTHFANNRIRYYFSGKEQKLEKFREKAYDVLGSTFENGGDRDVKFGVGVKVKAGLGTQYGAEVSVEGELGGFRSAHVHVEPGGGEITVTYSIGVEASVKGKAEAGLSGGEKTEEWSGVGEGERVWGGEAGASASASVKRNRIVKYRSAEDFIADLSGSSDLVNATVYNRVACLGKIWKAVKGVGRLCNRFATWVGLRIAKSREDNSVYRSSLRNLGIFRSTDSMFAHKENVVKTMTGKSDTFSVGVGASVSASFGAGKSDEDSTEVEKVNLFEGGAKIGGTYSYEGRVKKNIYRTALETTRLQSNEWLKDRAEGWFANFRPLESPLTATFKNLEEEFAEIDRLAGEYSKQDGGERWKELGRRLRSLVERAVYLERGLGGEVTEEQREVIAGFAAKLVGPDFKFPEEEFQDVMLEQTETSTAGRHTVSVDLHAEWDFFGGMTEDKVGELAESHGLRDFGGVGSHTVNEMRAALTPVASDVTINYTYSKPSTMKDVRPWHNGAVHTFTIGMAPGLTSRGLCELIAQKVVDKMTDGEEKKGVKEIAKEVFDDFWGAMQESAGIDLTKDVADIPLKELAKTHPEVADFLGRSVYGHDRAGLDFGVDSAYAKSVSFTWSGGRLTTMSISETTSVAGSVGFTIPIIPGVVSVGASVSDKLTTVDIDRHALRKPNAGSLLAASENYMRSGDHEGFKLFLTHNKPGVLRFLKSAQSERNAPEGDGLFAEDHASFTNLYRELESKLGDLADSVIAGNPDFADRINSVNSRLRSLKSELTRVDLNDDAMTDEEKIDLAQRIIEAMADGYTAIAESGRFTRDDAGNLVRKEVA